MTDPQDPADAALRFISMYSEVHQAMALTFTRYLKRTSPEVGRFINNRVRRLSDGERVSAITAIAVDVSASQQWCSTPSVLARLKVVRDKIGHSTLMGSAGEDDDLHVYAFGETGIARYTADDLMRSFSQSWWALEQVL